MPVTEQHHLRKDYPEGTRVRITNVGTQLRDPDMPGPMLSVDDEGTVTGTNGDYLIVEWDLGINRWIQLDANPFFSLGWTVDIISRPTFVREHQMEELAHSLLAPRG